MGSVTNKDTWDGLCVEFGGCQRDQGEGVAPNLAKMGKAGLAPKPEFKRSLAIVGRGGSQIGEVHGSGNEFVPKSHRGIAREMHGACFGIDCLVEALGPAILG